MLTERGNLISTGASIIPVASNGDADAMRALLAEGADVDQRGRGGHTPLMVAAIFSHVEIARILLAAGADVQLKDNLGLTARDWADRRGSWEVAQLLSNASPAEIEPSRRNAPGKEAQLKVEAFRRSPAAEPRTTPQQDAVTGPEQQLRTNADPECGEMDDVATLLSEQVAVATRSSTGATHSDGEEARHASATEPETARQPDALRFMKFHKQIMAAQERRRAEQASREAEAGSRSFPTETNISPQQDAHTVGHEQQGTKTAPERRQKEARPTATQSAKIAATIEHLKLLEGSSQLVEGAVRATSECETRATTEHELDHNEGDITLERRPPEMFIQPAMSESKISESFNPPPCKRCPECNTTYDNPLLMYCAYDATKLISADDSRFNYSAARDRSRQALWALVAIVTVLGASLGYLINNYRSRKLVPSAPVAAISSAPIPTQTEQPEIARNDSPLISGALSGMEVDVPEPEYPTQARAEGVSGTITVRVQVNQKGRVVLARSSAGDWRLRTAAVKAAQEATFSPEKLATHGGGVVSGIITYNFVAQTESPAATGSQVPTQMNSPVANGSSSATGSPAANAGGDSPVVGGPLTGTESNLPQPDYPGKAKSKGIQGTITVVVRVNRAGRVISWRTLEGDSQLRAAALKAAKKATFSPKKLPGTGEVVGTITYNFKP